MKYRFGIALVLIWCFVLTGCPSSKTLRVARENSAKMSIHAAKLIQANIDALKAGELTQAEYNELTRLSGILVDGIGVYRSVVLGAIESGNTDRSALDQIYDVFDDRVVAAFFALLARVNVLPGGKAEAVRAIISAIRITIRAIQGAFADARHELGLPEVNYARV